jgi:ribonucleoside-diphosphate reductase alpha chain
VRCFPDVVYQRSEGRIAMPQSARRVKWRDAEASQAEKLQAELALVRHELDEARRRPNRTRLADTRQSITHKFSICGHEGYVTVGLYEDGRPGEVFIKMAKQGSTISGLVDTIAVLTSLALQYGVPVEQLARKFEHTRFEPAGHTTNPDIRVASSISDYVFRWLGIQFCEDYRRSHAERSKEKG